MVGQRFNRLRVLEAVRVKGLSKWRCACDCGRETVVFGRFLLNGATRSCGCIATELLVARSTKHGETGGPEWTSWAGMNRRCYEPAATGYANYGGRGIRVHQPWRDSFLVFLADVGRKPTPRHTLDRIDSNGNYEPGNVRWATYKEQNNNRRSNVVISFNGRSQTIQQWAEELNVKFDTLRLRLVRGIPPERALTRGRLNTKGRSSNLSDNAPEVERIALEALHA